MSLATEKTNGLHLLLTSADRRACDDRIPSRCILFSYCLGMASLFEAYDTGIAAPPHIDGPRLSVLLNSPLPWRPAFMPVSALIRIVTVCLGSTNNFFVLIFMPDLACYQKVWVRALYCPKMSL